MVATRVGWITFQIGFLCLALGLVFGSIALFSALVGHVIVAAKGFGPMTDRPSRIHLRLAGGGLMGLAVSTFVVVLFLNALKYPSIYDVSTDVKDPPIFNSALDLRGMGSNPLVYNKEIAEIQQQAYPDIKSYVHETMSINTAIELVREVSVEMNWEIVADDIENAVLEAVATTFWYGFKDDIVVRVRHGAGSRGSIVDIRSASRVGVSDVGANARRIREFLHRLEQKAKDADL